MIDRDPSELVPKLGVAPGCKVALAPEIFLLAAPLRLAGCRVVSARAPVPNAALTIIYALSKADVPALAAFAHNLADVSSLWVAVPRRNATVDGLPPPEDRAELADLQAIFVPLGLTDNKLLSFGTMLVAYRFVRKRGSLRAEGGPDADLDLVEEKKRKRKPEERAASRRK
ncbi:hypothetical protein [Vulgatibacter incomptus]|uniref:Uncharacterized protein n=1 Tax=Vulgatibacter incomptus TaxID=1391653 RepID=A0A0K1PHV4_9BACT|nr:hypothetical protein [Vulgatibacter incomptus]AKU93092.1 hypothetical protein AKJ08_3479 [Vulgatibacter incomptus]